MHHYFHLNHSNLHHQEICWNSSAMHISYIISHQIAIGFENLSIFVCTVCVHVYNILEILTSVDIDCDILINFLVESSSLNLRNSLQLKSKFEFIGLNQFL